MTASADTAAQPAAGGADGPWAGYAPEHERPPLGSYLILAATFAAGMGTFLGVHRKTGRPLPERIETRDMVLLAGASFKLSRLITKEKITAFVRAPFTEYQGKGDAPAEVNERPRGTGLRAAIGGLLTCPHCVGMWIVSAFTLGLVTAPRETRFVASILSALGLSNLLQVGYRALLARAEPS